MAFVNQRSILPALTHCNIDRSFEPASDCVWANRIVVFCADVLRYCFGDSENSTSRDSVATYNQLVEYSQEWAAYKPESFRPIFYREAKGAAGAEGTRWLPEVWLLSDSVVTGLQHYHLARILLTAHNPKVPRLGPAQRVALKVMDVSLTSIPIRLTIPEPILTLRRRRSKKTSARCAEWRSRIPILRHTSCEASFFIHHSSRSLSQFHLSPLLIISPR